MHKYIASREFYIHTGKVMLPITIQSIINSLSGFIDTMMASKIDGVSAVGTALQIDTLMQGVTFGIAAGINIFVVQYYGAKQEDGMKKSFGLSLISVAINALLWMSVALCLNTHLLKLFIQDTSVVLMANDYLRFACFSYIFTSMVMSFTFAYHSVQKTYIPLFISILIMILHVFLNWLLMFELDLGVAGAGLSLTMTQMIHLLLFFTYSMYTKQPFIGKFKEMFVFQPDFIQKVIRKVYPLVINETLFSVGNSMFVVAYGFFGKAVMDCYYIGNQVVNIFYTVVNAMSDAATSMIGLELGKGDYDFAEKEVNYFFGMTSVLSIIVITSVVLLAPQIASLFFLPSLEQLSLSIAIIRVLSIRIAFRLFNVVIFAALRSGGDSKYLTFIDSIILWSVGLTLTFFLIFVMKVQSIIWVILIGQLEQLIRLILGLHRMKSKKWMNQMI